VRDVGVAEPEIEILLTTKILSYQEKIHFRE